MRMIYFLFYIIEATPSLTDKALHDKIFNPYLLKLKQN